MVCLSCGRATKGYTKCFACKSKEERDQAYELGYQAGFLKGMHGSALHLTTERWEQLRRLCHPDKHGDSRISTEIFQWLQEVKP